MPPNKRNHDNYKDKKYFNQNKHYNNIPYAVLRSITNSDQNNPLFSHFKEEDKSVDYENVRPLRFELGKSYLQNNNSSFYFNTRTKRQFSPEQFWQEGFFEKKQHKLKAPRYTTLPIKKSHILTTIRKRPLLESISTTEAITLAIADIPISHFNYQYKMPEKYLSFEELLTLRAQEDEYFNKDGRRKATTAITKKQATETTTKNTPTTKKTESSLMFYKLDHCSRKLTCTWTAINFNNSVASNFVSRTPPGYVEGCTRTSTCTRIYLERNKFPTSESGSPVETGDMDYCEKRSLKIQRRNLKHNSQIKGNKNKCKPKNHNYHFSTPPMNIETSTTYNIYNIKQNKFISQVNDHECICSDN